MRCSNSHECVVSQVNGIVFVRVVRGLESAT